MVMLTSDEIAQYRSALTDNPDALNALDVIDDCEGDLEDAAIALALRAGQEPDESDRWLEGLAKRWRVFLCEERIRATLMPATVSTAVRSLAAETDIPVGLATPVVLYVLKTGVDNFCKPLEEKL